MTRCSVSIFFFNDTATTEIYTLSLHDALPILLAQVAISATAIDDQLLGRLTKRSDGWERVLGVEMIEWPRDRKSTRLNSSHSQISYAVFCLKKKPWQDSAEHAKLAPCYCAVRA